VTVLQWTELINAKSWKSKFFSLERERLVSFHFV